MYPGWLLLYGSAGLNHPHEQNMAQNMHPQPHPSGHVARHYPSTEVMLAHAGYSKDSVCIENVDAVEIVTSQNGAAQAEDEEDGTYDEPGFGLGLPGLSSLSLPTEHMVVPPLNFSMVRVAKS